MGEELKTYLFIVHEDEENKITDSYIAVKQAKINDEIAYKTERIGSYGVIFTSDLTFQEVKNKLRMKKSTPYLLIELTGNFTFESISGFLPNTSIGELKNLNLENLKKSADWIKEELDKAVEVQDFEKAAKLRDQLKVIEKNKI
jgi:hypothetical protein